MILLPYYITKKELPIGCTMWTLWIFMASSGKELWRTDDARETIVEEYFHENGLFGEEKPVGREDVFAYRIDRTATKMSDFHTWSDSFTKPCDHLWRPFFWIGETCGKTDSWGWKEEVDRLKVDPFVTIGELWNLVAEV